jgi:hypothetical protein
MKLTTIIGLGTAGVGVLVVAAGVALAVKSMLRAASWTRIGASVIRAEMQSSVDSENRYFFNVYTFRYGAAGRTIESPLRASAGTTNEAEARSRLANHPAGTRREIFYNPANPSEIAWTGASGLAAPFAASALGLLFVVAGAIIWCVSQPAEW